MCWFLSLSQSHVEPYLIEFRKRRVEKKKICRHKLVYQQSVQIMSFFIGKRRGGTVLRFIAICLTVNFNFPKFIVRCNEPYIEVLPLSTIRMNSWNTDHSCFNVWWMWGQGGGYHVCWSTLTCPIYYCQTFQIL